MSGRSYPFPDFTADCASCAALCCVALHFDKGASFAFDKPAGTPCPHLKTGSFGCSIHKDLADRGFSGCIAFDCRGAGQRVMQEVFDAADWRQDPSLLAPMMDAFRVMRALQETLQSLNLLYDLDLSKAQRALCDDFMTALKTPTDGWQVDTLLQLEASGVFIRFKATLPQFRSAISRG